MHKLVLTVLLIANCFFSSACIAFGVINTDRPKHKAPIGAVRALVVNEDNEYLGLFGGLSSGYNQNGDLESTMLIISSSGYIAPVLNNGGIATVPVSYFQHKDCIGQEYQPATISLPEYAPYRGMVFRALSANDLVYIPKKALSKSLNTQSRLRFGHDGLIECDDLVDVMDAYKVERNQFKVTGIDSEKNYRLTTVAVESIRSTPRNPSIASDTEEAYGGVDRAGRGGNMGALQEECSSACLTNALGNGACDIECYVEPCFFDKGDCDNIAPDELQLMLSKVCSPGCGVGDIGDGFCDKSCDTQACQYDGGDCVQQ